MNTRFTFQDGQPITDLEIRELELVPVSAPAQLIERPPEYHDIRLKLREKIPKDFIEKRTGPGNVAVSYVTGEYVIRMANEIFGEDGWKTDVGDPHVEHSREGSLFETIARVKVRVTALGVYREDFGFDTKKSGSKIVNEENAIKAAVTDGIKRCMRQFGDAVGGSCYDKKYIRELNAISIPK